MDLEESIKYLKDQLKCYLQMEILQVPQYLNTCQLQLLLQEAHVLYSLGLGGARHPAKPIHATIGITDKNTFMPLTNRNSRLGFGTTIGSSLGPMPASIPLEGMVSQPLSSSFTSLLGGTS